MVAPMFRRVVTLAAGFAIVSLSAGCSAREPGHLDCSEREKAEVSTLATLPILQVYPASTQAAGTFSGCGVDDSGDPIAPHAGQRYRSTLDEAHIRSFYWKELAEDGWHSASTVIPPEVAPSLAFQRGISCLVKDVRATQVRFDIVFAPIPGASVTPSASHTYAIQVVAQADKEADVGCT